ncbi:MAG TPA: D-alanine--poly(phosphoribitol) ligase subunit DltA [Candidatus Udaeobacter sp.]|nr:D-alanine--poly(phosphoribitol) ligase subunit DltA [Candidatus Udaeobacter sp.]
MNLIQRIDHWAAAAPEAIAHLSGDRTLTYGELRRGSDGVASYLTQHFGDDRRPIAVLGHREPEMLIAFLGAVKSGRPYVPIDTALPQARIDQIVASSRAAFVLTPVEIQRFSTGESRVPTTPVEKNDPFYILFTSGSTGEPKGVIITLACLEHFTSWMLAEQQFSKHAEVFLNQAPFSFDLSVMDLYCSVTTGGRLFSIRRDLIENPKKLYSALATSGVTTWVSTPSFAQMCLAEDKFAEAMLPRVRRFLFCGETLAPQTAAELLARFPQAQVWNMYGPTEATVATTSIHIGAAILEKYSPLPVGRVMPDTKIFIVDENGTEQSANERGEIVIAGPNVSPGYLGRPGLTARAFFDYQGLRAYKTGDRGRFRDGLLFFEGRVDEQIKLSGYRIELGDVETNLRALPTVRDAVVIPVIKSGAAQSLTAFVSLVARNETSDFKLAHNLRSQLGERLPAYMLPRKFVFLDRFPMTANGKVDRTALAKSL